MSRLFFRTRTGQTPVDATIIKELKLRHVQTMQELYEHEELNIGLGMSWALSTNKNHLDYNTWLEVHREMLKDVWKFAGTIRKVDLANPDFNRFFDVRPSLLQLEKDLLIWIEFKTYPPEEMMAIFHERLLTIHPFRDGNGRWARLVTEFVCRKQSYAIPHWGKQYADDDEKRRLTYIEAVKTARHKLDHKALIRVMFG